MFLLPQFLFLDRADLPDHTLRASTTSQSVTPKGDLVTTTTTTYIKAPENQGTGAAGLLRLLCVLEALTLMGHLYISYEYILIFSDMKCICLPVSFVCCCFTG